MEIVNTLTGAYKPPKSPLATHKLLVLIILIISCLKYYPYTQVTNLKGLSNGGKTSSPLHTSWESPPSYQQAGSNTNNTKYGSGNTNTNNNPVNTTGRSLAEVWNV